MWIPFFNEEESPEMDRKQEMIIEDKICICPTIIQEILQGISTNANYHKTLSTIEVMAHLECDPYRAAKGAAKIYRNLRQKGITIRKSNDCLVCLVF